MVKGEGVAGNGEGGEGWQKMMKEGGGGWYKLVEREGKGW